MVFHCDRDDVFDVHRRLHDKFALSGGVPNTLLSFGQPEEVRNFTRRVLREVASEGGYILDAGAIMQDDTRIENLRAMTETCREHGVYAAGSFALPTALPAGELPAALRERPMLDGLARHPSPHPPPGICIPWEDRAKDWPEITGNPDLIRTVWDEIEALGNTYIWQLLLSF
jgi:hypothetical protein